MATQQRTVVAENPYYLLTLNQSTPHYKDKRKKKYRYQSLHLH